MLFRSKAQWSALTSDSSKNVGWHYVQKFTSEEWAASNFATAKEMEWFNDARFGMFIHFGLSTYINKDLCWGMCYTPKAPDPVEIYIAPNGNDKASGTREQPRLTFEKANEHVASLSGKKEVHIILKDGIYYLPNTFVFKPEHSGSEKYPVIFRAANEGKAIISGGEKLDLKWEAFKSGI